MGLNALSLIGIISCKELQSGEVDLVAALAVAIRLYNRERIVLIG